MAYKIIKKIRDNLRIYKKDLKTKGLPLSIIHRLQRYPVFKRRLVTLENSLKPSFTIVQNYKIYLDKNDSTISPELFLNKKWEVFETGIFKKNIKKGSAVLDIGAHIGYYTLIASGRVGPDGKVYAFEPDIKNFNLLSKNILENGCKNVILINKAVINKTGHTKLYLNEENTGDHRIYSSKENRQYISIQTVSLDDYFKGADEKIDLIKMDIQGSEFWALKGAVNLLAKNPQLKIITEFWPRGLRMSGSSSKDFLAFVKKLGFKIYEISENEKKLFPISSKDLLRKYSESADNYTNLLLRK